MNRKNISYYDKYNTLSAAIEGLKELGYIYDFQINEEGFLEEIKSGQNFSPDETALVEIHRFEGMTNPSDSSILYVLCTNTGLKGTLVDAYGSDGSIYIADFMNQLEYEQ
jgi:hypothetical protein